MPRVPELNQQVGLSAPNVQVTSPLRPAEGAFGLESDAALKDLGNQIQKTGEVATQRLIEMQQRADEQQVLDTTTRFQQALQKRLINLEVDENGVPKGFLSRQLNQAKGSTLQFDSEAAQVKKQYVDSLPGTLQKQRMNEILSAHLTNAREQIMHHEAQQGVQAFANSYQASEKMAVDDAAGLSDPKSVTRAIKTAYLTAEPALRHMGYSDTNIAAKWEDTAGKMVESSITPVLERDPKMAQKILDANKGEISPLDAAKLQNTIDGKIIHNEQMDAWNAVSNHRLSTGEVDLAYGQKYVNDLKVSDQHKEQILTFVHRMSSVADTELKQQRDAATRDFTNQLVTGQSKGLPYQDALVLAANYGHDATDIADKQNTVTELYTGKANAFDTWIKKQPEATQAAWSYAEESIKGKYGNVVNKVPGYPNPVKLADAAITELKQAALQKTPDQIRQLVNDKLKDVVVKPGWLWDTKDTGWKVDAGVRQLYSAETAQIEKDYGALRTSQARAFLIRNNVPITPKNLKAALDKVQE